MSALPGLLSVIVALALASPPTILGTESPGQRYLIAAARKGVSPFDKRVYEQLAKVHGSERSAVISGLTRFVLPPRPNPIAKPGRSDDAIDVLYRMGLGAVPVLIEALDDTTPSRMPMYDYSKLPKRKFNRPNVTEQELAATRTGEWKVNQLVGALIYAIADREFVVVSERRNYYIPAIGERPELVPQFKALILDWYAENAKRTPLERKIADVQSSEPYNRYSAIWWIGDHKEKAGLNAVTTRMEAILADKASIRLHRTELRCGAVTLGQLRDTTSVDVVRRICRELLRHAESSAVSVSDYGELFKAYRGLALLGKKDEALKELDQFGKRNSAKWHPLVENMYQRALADARKW